MTKARTLADNFAADISGITAGTGITGGGTSGTVTITNDMATAIDAKGDLVVGTGADAYDNLAAGSNGDTLVADSAATVGLRYQANFAAGKNKIINGDFFINQRGFTSASGSGIAQYSFDRWFVTNAGGTYAPSAEVFTPGTAPVAGYESRNYLRNATSGQSATSNYTVILQRIEDVRTLAGQTATISFWAKATSGTPKIGIEVSQDFGSGGSPSSAVNTAVGTVTLSTSWARYSATVSVPSISGKTIGTTANSSYLQINLWLSAGSDLNARASSIGLQNSTIDIWGVQVEAGSVATAFQTATGTLQGELAACQRYYFRTTASGANYIFGLGQCYTTTTGGTVIPFPVTMRVRPTALEQSGSAGDYQVYTASGAAAGLASVPTFAGVVTSQFQACVNFTTTVAGQVAGHATQLNAANSSAYLGWSAEL